MSSRRPSHLRFGPAPAIVLGLLTAAAVHADIEVAAQLAPGRASIEQAVRLTIEVRSDRGQPGQVHPDFELENLQRMGPPRRSQTFRFVAGRSYHELRLIYFLRPLSTGPAEVRSIRIEVDRDVYELPPQRIEIVTDPPSNGRQVPGQARPRSRRFPDPWAESPFSRPRPSSPTRPKVFVRASVSPERPWVGQQAIYRLTLYTQANVASISAREIPPFQGFWAEEVTRQQEESEIVTIEGETYGRAVIMERVLVPRRAGTFDVEPTILDLVLRIQERRGFGRTFEQLQQSQATSNPVTVEVRELPDAPPGFAGAVGSLAVDAEMSTDEVAVGESATLSVTYRGTAHLAALPAPELPEIPGLDVYPPEESTETMRNGDRLVHLRTWTYTLAPRTPGRFRLGPFQMPLYDTRRGTYRTAAADELVLTARAVPGTGPAAAAATGTLHPIRSAAVPRDDGPLGGIHVLPWLVLLPLGLVVALRWTGRRNGSRDSVAPDDAVGRLRERLDELESSAPHLSERAVAQSLEEAWRDVLTDRWGVSPALPASRWAENLEERRDLIPDGRRLDASTLSALGELVREIHYLRHAPQLSDTAAVRRELVRRSRRLLRRLS